MSEQTKAFHRVAMINAQLHDWCVDHYRVEIEHSADGLFPDKARVVLKGTGDSDYYQIATLWADWEEIERWAMAYELAQRMTIEHMRNSPGAPPEPRKD